MSRVINTYRASSQWPSRGFSRLSRTGVALGGAIGILTLSGCYYPYGYYPAGYPAYYATVPSTATQQAVPAGQGDPADAQQQQAQAAQQNAPTYAVAATPPVYMAPAYPAYYPPVYPAYPAYYPYPAYYGPSIAIGVGGYWGGGWGHHHWH